MDMALQRHRKANTSVVLVAVLLFASVGYAEVPSKDPCDLSRLPEPVGQVLQTRFSQWRPWSLSDLTDEERTVWRKRTKNEKVCPGIAVGHFKHRMQLSYAFSLVPHDFPTSLGWRLLVVSEKTPGQFLVEIVRQSDDFTGTGFMFRVPPGKYEDVYQSQEVHLALDGFQRETYEKGASLYYWHNGMFRQLILID